MFILTHKAPDPRMDVEAAKEKAGAIAFPPGSQALFLGRAHYGCLATVLPSLDGEVVRPRTPLMRVVQLWCTCVFVGAALLNC